MNGFQPDKPMTRFEMMKWMASGLAASDKSFKQALADTANTLLPTPETYKGGIADKQVPFIAVIRGTGIITGMQDGMFRPADPVSKAELAASLLRCLDYHHFVNGYSKRYKFVRLEELGMSLEAAIADAYDTGYMPHLGV
ncbi:S-layer homology domain-containing protein [Paenibacillus algorifonticola]|uniref:S-layer homology domain-containing protein n=1 Tax=Paenibacillus algorifonticola TaxID=684063 RepID=A0A1I2HUM3_9BACL|nr:S-layer homology domain-containing protein [Paenibacillus algorifonticola]SFF33629.1 S-layer homology domain-containing protein [Paenibacillus algorifonticola]